MMTRLRYPAIAVIAVSGLLFGRRVFAQALPSDSLILKAASLEASGDVNGAHALLRQARDLAKSKGLRDQYRLVLAASLVGQNRLSEAERELASIEPEPSGASSPASATLAFAKAMIAGFSNDRQRVDVARASLTSAFGNNGLPLAQRAMFFVVSGLKDSATAVLAEIDNTPIPGVTNEQFTAGFRGLLALRAGDCGTAKSLVGRAPVQQGSLIQAIKAKCAQREGNAPTGQALRDSVVRRSPAEMYQWPAIIARNVVSSREN